MESIQYLNFIYMELVHHHSELDAKLLLVENYLLSTLI